MTQGVTDSRFAIYEGLIALAWTDGVLHSDEEAVIRSLIDSHHHFSEEQRQSLHDAVTCRTRISDIWPRITGKQDRARFLDYADMIMKADGVVHEREDTLYSIKLAKHLGTLDVDAITRELTDYRMELNEQDIRRAEEDRLYASQYGLVGFVKRLFGRDRDTGTDQKDIRHSA